MVGSPGEHNIFTPRRGPSWPRIGITLLGVLGVIVVALWAVGWAANLIMSPAAAPLTAHAGRRSNVATSSAPTPRPPKKSGSSLDGPSGTTKVVLAKPRARVAARKPAKAATKAASVKTASAVRSGFVVVIDAGHQGQGDNRPEPIGPGASTTKPAVADGAEGIVTHRRESVDNLDVSLKLRDALQSKGVKVIMVRTSENVDIANSERAKIANRAHAGLFIRLHCDGVDDQSVHGLLTLVPAANQWTGPIVTPSARAGRDIQSATLSATGAYDRGITPRSDMSGFNWSQVPSVIVEMGVMSNPAEDRLLASDSYQQRLASGMAAGILAYAAGR